MVCGERSDAPTFLLAVVELLKSAILKSTRRFFQLGFVWLAMTLFVSNASAQMTLTPSAGCTAANNGDFDFATGAGSGLVSSAFADTFFAADVLTFTLVGEGLDSALAEDITDGVDILTALSAASVDYSIPSDGTRDFNLELDTNDFGAEIAVTCTPASGSIAITKASDIDGDFEFTGDLGDFILSVAGASATQTFSSLAPGSYAVSELMDGTTELTGIVCVGDTDNGGSIDVANREATIDLDGGEAIQCTFTNAENIVSDAVDMAAAIDVAAVSAHAIRNFLYRRANAILSEEPDRPRLIRKTPGVLWEGGVDRLRIDATDDTVDADFAASSGPVWGNKVDLWVEGRYASYNYDNGLGVNGDLGVVYVGADFLLSEDVMIGALGQFDWMNDDAVAVGESLNGNGWMAGPYFSARLDKNLIFDARAAWGRSKNDLVIPGLGVNDSFDTSRWLLRGALTGNHQFGDGKWRLTPTASVAYYEEQQEAYLSGTGVNVGPQTIALGRMTFSPELARRFVTQSGVLIEPQITLAGLWDFETPDGLSMPGWAVSTDEFRMRAEAALMVAWPSGIALRAAGIYDGIGANSFEAYGARLWLDIPIGTGPRTRPISQASPPIRQCDDGMMVPAADVCPVSAPDGVVGEVPFAAGKFNLSGDAYAAINAAWNSASAYDIVSITIAAGGDDDPASVDDILLAENRARAIGAALKKLGAPTDRIFVVPLQAGTKKSAAQILFELR